MQTREPGTKIEVRTFKYDGKEHRRWRAELLRQEESLILLDAKFEEKIEHPLLGLIESGTLSLEYYWLDRWYNIFRFLEPSGELRSFYCNVSVPPVFDGQNLSYIDLDMDVLVSPDLSYRILDEDEFAENALRFNYPQEVLRKAQEGLEELVSLIEAKGFPFQG